MGVCLLSTPVIRTGSSDNYDDDDTIRRSVAVNQ